MVRRLVFTLYVSNSLVKRSVQPASQWQKLSYNVLYLLSPRRYQSIGFKT